MKNTLACTVYSLIALPVCVAARFSDITDPNSPNSAADAAKRRNFCAIVTELDEEIGRIMGKLKERGLDEKTLVIYVSDNGGWLSLGGNNGQLRGGKWGIYEGGQRVPFIWRWPGVLPAGKDIREKNNVAGEQPEMLDALNKEWDQWNATLPPAYVPVKPK
jgi:phosphoglycerol transferase MdoB-like AlkP superfamily enzyme